MAKEDSVFRPLPKSAETGQKADPMHAFPNLENRAQYPFTAVCRLIRAFVGREERVKSALRKSEIAGAILSGMSRIPETLMNIHTPKDLAALQRRLAGATAC
jgi:hypothetical protein